MSKGIRYNGDYSIANTDLDSFGNPTGNLTVKMHTMTINGNLDVVGIVRDIQNTSITDIYLTLNGGESGNGVTGDIAGIQVDRGPNPAYPMTSIRWNEKSLVAGIPTPRWELSNDGITWNGIAVTNQSGTQFALIQDMMPQLGANLDVLGQTIFSSNNEVVVFGLNGENMPGGGAISGSGIAIENTRTGFPPNAIPDHTVVYTQPPQNGGTGLYVTTTSPENTVQEELISKAKAIAYALIL
jgi:hypothetical protein